MDFSFTEEQQAVSDLATRILEGKVTEDLLRSIEAGTDRFDLGVWEELGRAGLLGIGLPEDVGGGGYGILEQCLVLEQVGRTLAPAPVWAASVLGAAPVAAFGTPEQKARFAAPAADGGTVVTAALVEPLNPAGATPVTAAARDGAGWRLDGEKTCVPAVLHASAVLVPASGPEGTSVFVVDLDTPGLTVEPQRTTNGDTEGYLLLEGVAVGDDRRLPGDGADILEWTVERATVGLCALQLGITEEALRRTAAYAGERVQFERPIATFQAVGHRCADAYIDVEGIRMTLWQAAWRVAAGLRAAMEVEVAKLWAAEGGHRVAHTAVHIHGGMGIAMEYPLHRYFVAAKQVEFTLGGATEQRLRIGARLAAEAV
ncbi:MAG TPA: acyl-CoA dehydrogenase family protein [Acidimicrobiales bacterium]|nr:acyl-CoA dehydrogenase family protein [Acidimicrobiales bacterium]